MEKRPLFVFGAAIFAGAFSSGLRPWYLTYIILASAPVLCLFYCARHIVKERRFVPEAVIIAAIASILPAAAYCDCVDVWKSRIAVYNEYDSKEVEATLRLASRATLTENSLRFEAAPVFIEGNAQASANFRAPPRIMLSFGLVHGEALSGKLMYGDVITVRGRLSKPIPQQNEYLFDYRKFMFSKGIAATIYAGSAEPKIISEPRLLLGLPLNPIGAGIALSERIEHVFFQVLPPKEAALITAMLVGNTDRLDEESRNDFAASGLLHLMAVSGLHIAIISNLMSAGAMKAGLSKRSARTVSLSAIVVFTFIAGFSPSVARAALTYGLCAVSKTAGRSFDRLTALGLAAIILLACDPMQAFGAGFLLSFASALSICLISNIIRTLPIMIKLPRAISDSLCVSLSICIGCFPIQAALFHGFSAVSALSNLLCAPLVVCVLAAGIVTALTGLIAMPLTPLPAFIATSFLWAVENIASAAAHIPNAMLRTGALSPAALFFYYSFAALLLSLQNKRAGSAGRGGSLFAAAAVNMTCASVILVVCAAFSPGIAADEMEIVFLDVGNSNAAFIDIGGRYRAVVDAGGAAGYPGYTAPEENRLYEYLTGRGIGAIDLAIATHGDSDHIQGFTSVLERMPVYNFIMPHSPEGLSEGLDELEALALEKGSRVAKCGAGDIVSLGAFATVEVLSPFATSDDPALFSDFVPVNDYCLVTRIVFGDMKALFCGDIGNIAETELVYSAGKAGLASQLMSAPHHGSKYSSGEMFLRCVSPEAAVAGVGKNNYGHPAPEAVGRYADAGADFYRTDRDGMVSVLCDRGGISRIRRYNDMDNLLAWQRNGGGI